MLLLGGVSLVFWCAIFAASLRVLSYFNSIEDIGRLLAFKLLSMILITVFSLLVFSSILTHLSKLYLSRDLFLVHSMPVCSHKIFLARWIESTFDSAWMVIIFTMPVFMAYGVVNRAEPLFYILLLLALAPLSLMASGISSLLVQVAAVLLPANRIRSIFLFLSLFMFMILFVIFRLLRPERLVNPESFASVMIYLQSLQTPASPLLPTTWVFDIFKNGLLQTYAHTLLNIGLLWSGAFGLIFLNINVAAALYFKGFSRAQTAPVRLFRSSGNLGLFGRLFSGSTRALVLKEIKTFFRDQTQWSQIFLVAALIVIYVYNFKVLPLDKAPIKTVYLQNLLSFLNMGLAAFVLTAVSGRFVYPAISMEGEAFWIIKTAPISIKAFLWVKFFVYLFPLLLLTETLIVVTNIFLQVTPLMMGISTVTILFMVPAVVSIGIGLGAAYPDFKSENPAQTVTSLGGLIFMMLCAGYIALVIVLEAGPVYQIFMAGVAKRALSTGQLVLIGASFAAVLGISVAAILIPIRYGARKLSNA